jgi:hypothetical protein
MKKKLSNLNDSFSKKHKNDHDSDKEITLNNIEIDEIAQ